MMIERDFRMLRREEGQVLVEFTLSVLVFLILLFGIMEFGRALYIHHTVSIAARMGARYAVVRAPGCNAAISGCPVSQTSMTTYIESIAPNLKPSNLTVSLSYQTGNNSCPAGTNPNTSPGCAVQVAVNYRFVWLFSFLPTTTMSSTSQMIIAQ